jgi:hypothetical protein
MTGAEAQAAETKKVGEFTIYSEGFCFCSVCTSLTLEEAEERVNAQLLSVPTRWTLHDGPFKGGESNPCPCNKKPETHKHMLFSC